MDRRSGSGGESNDDIPDSKDHVTNEHGRERSATDGVDRRSFLRLAGGAAAGIGLGSVGASAAEDYETWTVTSSEVHELSDGEVVSNVLIDQTHPDGNLTFVARNSTDWEVRNVGFLGTGVKTDNGGSYHFQVSTPSGGNGLIENVWMSGKGENSKGTRLGGIFLRRSHAGHVDVRHTYIEGFGNNAVYGSNPGQSGGGNGSVTVENAYHRDNTVAQFRIGTPGSVVRNSLAIVNDPEGLRGDYISGNDNFNARGIWARRPNEVDVENCSVYVSPEDIDPDGAFEASNDAVLNVTDCDLNPDAPKVQETASGGEVRINGLGETPTADVIGGGGVPLSPEMAASGEREMPAPSELPDSGATSGGSDGSGDTDGSDGDSDSLSRRTLAIDGTGAGWTDYEFTVSGSLSDDPDVGSLGSGDSIEGTTASGFVNGGIDGYRFTGEVTDVTLDGDATLLVDGTEYDGGSADGQDADDSGSEDGDGESTDAEKVLAIDGTGEANSTARYRFTVTGSVSKDQERTTVGDDALPWDGLDDSASGSEVVGIVGNGVDAYRFTGTLTDIDIRGNARFTVLRS